MPESDLPILVACIDDPRPARATLDGAPVTLGVVCYQALRLVAYVEATGWPGHIGPLASPAARRAAKRAWQAVLAEGRRTEERRGGKEGVRTGRYRWSRFHLKKNKE